MEGVPNIEVKNELLDAGYDIVNFLADTQIFPSKGEARKMWQAGGLGLNKEKVSSDKTQVTNADLLKGKYLLVQKGMKNYYLVTVVE
jgi:tyrosyl-tRNA synthetase